jgi:hypothetical protein
VAGRPVSQTADDQATMPGTSKRRSKAEGVVVALARPPPSALTV